MAREIFINGGIFETRLALCDEQRLLEIHHMPLGAAHGFDDLNADISGADTPLEGRIYLGRVVHVAKQLNAVFVDIGESSNGFLPLSAMPQDRLKTGHLVPTEGEALMVQVVKEGFGDKGPRLSARIDPSLAGKLKHAGNKVPCLLHAGAGALCAALVKMAGEERVARISLDHAAAYAFLKQCCPGWAIKCLHRAAPEALFANAGIEDQIDEARSSIHVLPGGGSLIIEPTSAFTAIDVNAGAMQAGNLRQKINLEAARAIPRQLRLRGIGGQIVIDFLAMKNKSGWMRILDAVRRGLECDPAITNLEQISRGGLLAITRERRFAPLTPPRPPQDPPRSASAAAHEILRELQSAARHRTGRRLQVKAPAAVLKWLEKQPGLNAILEREMGIAPSWHPLEGAKTGNYEIFKDAE